jgi:plastocyanin
MNRLLRPTLALVVTLALGACGSSSSPNPAASTAASNPPAASVPAASVPAASAGGGGAACAPAAAGAAATVTVTIKEFTFTPNPQTAQVGDTVGWSNGDTAGHTATLDDGTCTTDTIANGATGALTFTAAGTYAYHCSIHSQMKGTVTVTG